MDTQEILNGAREFLASQFPEGTGWGFSVMERNGKILVWVTGHPGNVNPTPDIEESIAGMLKLCPQLQGQEYAVGFTQNGGAEPAVPAEQQPGALPSAEPVPEGLQVPGIKLRPVPKFKQGQCVHNRCTARVTAFWAHFWLCDKHHKAYKKKAKDGYLQPDRDLGGEETPPEQAVAPVEPSQAPEQALATQAPGDLQQEAQGFEMMQQQLTAWSVQDQAGLDHVNTLLGQVRARAAALEEERTSVTKPMNAALRKLNSQYKPLKDILGQVESLLKRKVMEAQQTFAAQQQAMMQQAQATQQQALAAQAQGDVAGYQQGMQQVSQQVATAYEDATPDMKGMQIRENWQYRIVDATAVPREYLCVDERLIAKIVKASKGATKIPGVEVFDAGTVAVPK